jgi:hypothetical protein
MPTPPTVAEIMRVRIGGALPNAALWGVRFYVGYAGPAPIAAQCLTFAEDIVGSWHTRIDPYRAETVTNAFCDVVDLSSVSGSSATADVSTAGTVASASCDNQVAATVKFEIARRYRGGKPKMFVPGISVDYILDNSHWTTAFCNDMGTAFTNFNDDIEAMAAGGIDLTGIFNVGFYHGFTAVENPITHRWRNVPTYLSAPNVDIVESFTCDQVFGSQKRRRTA